MLSNLKFKNFNPFRMCNGQTDSNNSNKEKTKEKTKKIHSNKVTQTDVLEKE